jgi:hypothetical protein
VVSSLEGTEVHFEAEPRKRAGDYTVVLFTHKGEIPRINLPVTTHFMTLFSFPLTTFTSLLLPIRICVVGGGHC